MPIENPKTGEQDYVDVSLINKIIVEPENMMETLTNRPIRINMALEHVKLDGDEKDYVGYVMKLSEHTHPSDMRKLFTLQEFEQIMSTIIHGDTSKRLEQTDEFVEAATGMLNEFIVEKKKEKALYARIGQTYASTVGIGIVHDKKAGQDVGTFEHFSYGYDKGRSGSLRIEDILLSVRTVKELVDEVDRFTYHFYSLEDQAIYDLVPAKSPKEEDHVLGAATFAFDAFTIGLSHFENDHEKYAIVQESQAAKAIMDNVSKADPLYQEDYEKFRETRFGLLRSIQQKAEMEKIKSNFTDIELDF